MPGLDDPVVIQGLRPWINYRTDDGQTPVMAASLAGHAEVRSGFQASRDAPCHGKESED